MSEAREERYLVRSLTPARLKWARSDRHAEVLLENVSSGGAAITMYQEPQVGDACTLEFKLGSESLCLPLHIKWTRESGRGQWLTGCQFDRPLKRATFARAGLAAQPERKPFSGQAVMRRESAPEYPYPVTLRDVSSGGVGIAIDEPFDAGERVILELEGPPRVQFVVVAQWSAMQNGESLVGFSFEDADDANRFHNAFGVSTTPTPHRSPVLGASGVVLVGTLLAAAIVVLARGAWPF